MTEVFAQSRVRPQMEALRIQSDDLIQIDGTLTEEEWTRIAPATNFTQYMPVDGGTPTQKTEAYILYTDKYLYVGVVAHDTAPDSIAATLFRRDGNEYSDWFFVNIDSYNDKLTAFGFGINPRGVQKDIMYFNDVDEDVLWNAVWNSATQITDAGWTAEMQIPLSQLRFTSFNTIQEWGINFERHVARNDEINYWAPVPRQEYGVVSWFGTLNEIQDLSRPLRLEVQPYVSGALTNDETGNPDNPFYNENDWNFRAGGDIKYGITSDITLTATINPDFGQVEADPAVINLTVFEQFFREQRPFFLEGVDIFNFGGSTSVNTFRTHQNFYSRRIGRQPFQPDGGVQQLQNVAGQDTVSIDYESRPSVTTIAGAAKVSGKTRKGLTVGFLNAYTLQENAQFTDLTRGIDGEYMIEPATNFMVSRFRQDLKDGNAQVGGFLSSVNRNMRGNYLDDYIHNSAYQFGVDGQYYWGNRNWGVSGVFAGSQVAGTQEAMLRTQTTSARYYNRVDSEGFSVDSSRTSLSGYYGEFSIGKYGGTGFRYSFTYTEMSPGYEVNDIGFLERADYRAPSLYTEYLNVSAERVRFYLLWAYTNHAWNFDGDIIFNYYASGAYFQFHNLSTLLLYGGLTGTFYDDRSARGGATLQRPRDWNTRFEYSTNTTKNVVGSFGATYRQDASGEETSSVYSRLDVRPASFIQFSIAPTYSMDKSTNEKPAFFDPYDDPVNGAFFSNAHIDMFYADFRLNWTFSPQLSLQTFLRPLIYSANFHTFKYFNESKTYNFTTLEDLAGPETARSFDQLLDFNYRTIQGNAVLRYEYRPGSTIFLVWQQQRESTLFRDTVNDPLPGFNPVLGTGRAFTDRPLNIFLIKFSYWFGT